jgi:hypothetical protein
MTLLGRGSKLIGGAVTTTLTLDDVHQVLLEGFFPVACERRDACAPAAARAAGNRAALRGRSAVTRHLARFLARQAGRGRHVQAGPAGGRRLVCPTHVLFNGGVMKAGRCARVSWRC